jgi:3-phosphoshikimate 1-carboxyvinyltransferase
LRHFGAQIASTREGTHGRKIALTGQPELHGADVVVPADPSSAAFPIVAALIVEGSDLVLSDVMTNPLRTGLFTTLREMGASIEQSELRGDAGEPMAQFRVRASKLRGVEVEISGNDMMIEGKGHVAGNGLVATHMDHRIAMSALVMGLASDAPVKVDDTAFIATSFPDFIPMMRGLGAEFS